MDSCFPCNGKYLSISQPQHSFLSCDLTERELPYKNCCKGAASHLMFLDSMFIEVPVPDTVSRLSDASLLARFRAGDDDAASALCSRYSCPLMATSRRRQNQQQFRE
jgi:hypothetical protein